MSGDLEEHAREMGVNPDELRRFLAAGDRTPPSADQTDDLPKLRARLAEMGGAR